MKVSSTTGPSSTLLVNNYSIVLTKKSTNFSNYTAITKFLNFETASDKAWLQIQTALRI